MNNKKNHFLSSAPFLSLGCIIACLIVTSILEKEGLFEGYSPYTSTPFIALWGILVLLSSIYIHKKKLWKRAGVFSIHAAFLMILCGALITHLTSFSGQIHLRNGESGNLIQTNQSNNNDAMGKELPFTIRLDQFSIITYPGTDTPADYQSDITLTDQKGSQKARVSMNKIVRKDGYRLFQQSYDADGQGSVLMVSYDKWGARITYIGYLFLLIGMGLTLFDPKSNFRNAIKNSQGNANIWKGGAIALLLCATPWHSASAESLTLTEQEAEAFGNILVQHQERITTLSCLANDFTKKLTGKNHYKDYNATQVLAGWLFSREEWQYEPMFKVKGQTERSLIGIDQPRARFVDFFDSNGEYKLRKHYMQKARKDLNAPELKPIKRLDEEVELVLMLQSGALLNIFPAQGDYGIQLFSPRNFPQGGVTGSDSILVNNFLPLLYEKYSQRKNKTMDAGQGVGSKEDCTHWIEKFCQYQREKLGDKVPSQWRIDAEKLYLRIDKLPLCSYITLLFGIISLFCLFLKKGADSLQRICHVSLFLSCAYLTLLLSLRGVVSGRLPLANGHETLLCIAWMAQLFALCFYRRWHILLQLGLMASGFAMLTATLGAKDPQITPLIPVLNSPLLSLHVTLMMISYTLLFFVTLSSLIALLSHWLQHDDSRLAQHQTLNTIILYPALFCLTAGIFLGAVWANVSWGCYWSWDPKETWALISLLIYSYNFHGKSLPFLQKSIRHHLYQIITFIAILFTYFGVNYLFGGMHSYGG